MKTRSVVVALAAATLLLSACGQSETRDEGGEIISGGDTDVFSLQIGDCFNDTPATTEGASEVQSLPTVPCSEPHDNEVYAEYTFPDGDYPGDAEMEETATTECLAQWEAFVGLPYEESTLVVYPIYPTQASWDGLDDRLVTCALWSTNGQTTGTLEGSAL